MYNYHESISLEFGEQWGIEFQRVLSKAIDSTEDPEKKSDLKHCQNVVKEIKDDAGFLLSPTYISFNRLPYFNYWL